ncbi:DUF983 domain-containing protein [Limibacter armeniacum]|uniref:DUF983 domain-containing protein n=1 Tax=Limibacter armeniacum TaxID=466084 RepID=UPI002FE5810D
MVRLVKKIIRGKCPICGKEKVFGSKGNVFLFKAPKMKECCPNCQHKFEKEPGYFMGAMYVSYALSIAEMVTAFIISRLLGVPSDYILYLLLFIVMILWPFNFRMSRIIWMYLT